MCIFSEFSPACFSYKNIPLNSRWMSEKFGWDSCCSEVIIAIVWVKYIRFLFIGENMWRKLKWSTKIKIFLCGCISFNKYHWVWILWPLQNVQILNFDTDTDTNTNTNTNKRLHSIRHTDTSISPHTRSEHISEGAQQWNWTFPLKITYIRMFVCVHVVLKHMLALKKT